MRLLNLPPAHNRPATLLPLRRRLLCLTLGLTALWVGAAAPVQAETAETAPDALKVLLTEIDEAANRQDLEAVMRHYSPAFANSDGLVYSTLQEDLKKLWERYPQLSYQTELLNWEQEGSTLMAETVTTITGTQSLASREVQLKAQLRSRQAIDQDKIVRQEILAEQSQLTTGTAPPTVTIKLPEAVKVGQTFSFDAIVEEPLGDSLLLGAIQEKPVRANGFFEPVPTNLELLSAGGIFKLGRAPIMPDNRWITVTLIRPEGMTFVTQRLRVVERIDP
ncbi:nuclear transport factor 2 family protein [Trichothermofontia sp.]